MQALEPCELFLYTTYTFDIIRQEIPSFDLYCKIRHAKATDARMETMLSQRADSAETRYVKLLDRFPDIKITRVEQHESGDKVYTYAYWEATHSGNFMGIAPTGKRVHVEYMDIWRAKDGKIAENWVVMDIMGLMVQLGVVPPPTAGK